MAAQYCQHEESKDVSHLGHHTHKHDVQGDADRHVDNQESSNNTPLDLDADCLYCHLGSIQSNLHSLPVLNKSVEPVVLVDLDNRHPEIIPSKPERPNWNFAV